jgi:hypothetical protein
VKFDWATLHPTKGVAPKLLMADAKAERRMTFGKSFTRLAVAALVNIAIPLKESGLVMSLSFNL